MSALWDAAQLARCIRLTFAEHEGKTKLTVHQTYSFESDATRGAPQGWTETLEHLAAYVAKNLNREN